MKTGKWNLAQLIDGIEKFFQKTSKNLGYFFKIVTHNLKRFFPFHLKVKFFPKTHKSKHQEKNKTKPCQLYDMLIQESLQKKKFKKHF